MRVKNTWKRPIRVGRQIIIKDAVEDIPEHLLLQPRVQKLRASGKLIFPYHGEVQVAAKPPVVVPEPVEVVTGDDLTQLVHVGERGANLLNSFGIFTFQQVVEHKPTLHEVLEVSKNKAAEIVRDAEKKVG